MSLFDRIRELRRQGTPLDLALDYARAELGIWVWHDEFRRLVWRPWA